jgi:peptide/nickel transport system substrate-binding protein
LLRSKSGLFENFYVAVDNPPFNDVNVRQAIRLLVDRQQMVDVAYAGFGAVSNDVPGRYVPYYDDELVRDGMSIRRSSC